MKKILILLPALILLSALSACRIERADSNEPTTTRHIAAAGFDRVSLAFPAEVTYIPSDTFGVDVKAPESTIRKLDIRVKDGQLCIGKKDDDRDGEHYLVLNGKSGRTSITVHAPRLAEVVVAGSGDFVCNDTLRTDRFRFAVAGSGSIEAKCIEARSATFSVAGSGSIETAIARAARTDISIAGSGSADVAFAGCKEASVSIMGSGDIELEGDVEHLTQNISGSGDIDTHKLTIRK